MKIINKLIQSFDIIERERDNTDKIWMSRREFKALISVIVWFTRSDDDFNKWLHILHDRFRKIWDTNGSNFLFLYMKECTRITVSYFAGSPVAKTSVSGVLVRVDPDTSLPSIFPTTLRQAILKWTLGSDWKKITGLLTFLCLFRSLSTNVKPSFDSIESPFNGLVSTIDSSLLTSALKELTSEKITFAKGRMVNSYKAGPNSKISVWGAEIDAFGLITKLATFSSFLKLCLSTRSYLIIIWCIIIIIVGMPYFLISMLLGCQRPTNGRLGIVKSQAGKARVVAMTNYWIQCLFSGLHDRIFDILRGIPSDATFNQRSKAIKYMYLASKGKTFYCYDLTAATDRLPILIQSDILNILGYRGDLWMKLIKSIDWSYRSDTFKYSVGQPMGALSSWGMLALTHHVIVRVAAQKVGKVNFQDYLVLGDDIVIGDYDVSQSYLHIMKELGVSINLSKSIISDRFGEFAKMWVGPEVEISPIGSGLLLQSIRDRSSLSLLLQECERRFLLNPYEIYVKRVTSPTCLKGRISSFLWQRWIIDLRKFVGQSIEDANASIIEILTCVPKALEGVEAASLNRINKFKRNYDSYFEVMQTCPDLTIVKCIRRILEDHAVSMLKSDYKVLKKGISQFLLYSFRTTSLRLGMPALFDLLFLPFKPGWWFNLGTLFSAFGSLLIRFFYLEFYFWMKDYPLTEFCEKTKTIKWIRYKYDHLIDLTHLSLLCKLGRVEHSIPMYIEEERKRKDLAKVLNQIDRSVEAKLFVSSLKKGNSHRIMNFALHNFVDDASNLEIKRFKNSRVKFYRWI